MTSVSAVELAERYDYHRLLKVLKTRPFLAQETDDYGMTALHWICSDKNVPLQVVQKVIVTNPKATSIRNLAGLLPLHIAVRKSQSIPTLKTLLRYYPKAIVTETREGKTPLDIAEDLSLPRSTMGFLKILEAEYEAMGQLSEEQRMPEWKNQSLVHEEDGTARSTYDTTTPSFPPTWRHSKTCYMCEVKFGYFKSRHHCRNCGESVCNNHSKRSMPLRHIGLYDPERVCNLCYDKLHARLNGVESPSPPPAHQCAQTGIPQSPPYFTFQQPREKPTFDLLSPRISQRLSRHRSYSDHNTNAMPNTSDQFSRTFAGNRQNHSPAPMPPPVSSIKPYASMASIHHQNLAMRQDRANMQSHTLMESRHRSNNQANAMASRRLAKTELEVPKKHWKTSEEQKKLGEQVSELEKHVQKLLLAKKKIGEALKQSQEEIANVKKEQKKLKLLEQDQQEQQEQQEEQKHLGYAKSYESSNQDNHDQLIWFASNQQETILDDEFPVLEDSQISHSEADEEEIDFMKLSSFRALSPIYGTSSMTEHHNDADVSPVVSPSTSTNTTSPQNEKLLSPQTPPLPDDPILSGLKNFSLSPKTPPLPLHVIAANTPPLPSSKESSSYKQKHKLISDLHEPIDIASTCNDLGLVLLKKGDFSSAAEQFQKSLKLRSTNHGVWCNLAKALDGMGESQKAEEAVSKAFELAPDSLSALSLHGRLLHAKGQHDEAIEAFRRALKLQEQIDRHQGVQVYYDY